MSGEYATPPMDDSDHEREEASLRQRLRSGELTEHKLRLAAYLGNARARSVLSPDIPIGPADLEEWVAGFEPWGQEACVRALVALARMLLPIWERRHPGELQQRAAIEAAEAWIRHPGEAEARAASLACDESYRLRVELQAEGADYLAASVAAGTAYAAAAVTRADEGKDPVRLAANSLVIAAAEIIVHAGPETPSASEAKQEIRSALVQWLLG